MINFLSNDLAVTWLTNAAVSGTASSAAIDTTNLVGNVFVAINCRASGTGTSTLTLEHSDSESTGYEAVPADGIVSLTTSLPVTVSALTTAASNQTVALRRDYIRRYVRIGYAGGTTHNVAAIAGGLKKYTEG